MEKDTELEGNPEFVAGFLFDDERDEKGMNSPKQCLFIEKSRPDHLKGLWCGVGGRIEEGETPREAMVREFKEEAGLEGIQWEAVGMVNSEDPRYGTVIVYVFRAFSNMLPNAKQMTDEGLVIMNVEDFEEFRTKMSMGTRLSFPLVREPVPCQFTVGLR